MHYAVQIRDMTGTGEVLKRRLREGRGEFPIDCPLEDNAVRVHYKAFRLDTKEVCPPSPFLQNLKSPKGNLWKRILADKSLCLINAGRSLEHDFFLALCQERSDTFRPLLQFTSGVLG